MAYVFSSLLLLVSLLVPSSQSWSLPAREFLEIFADTFQMEGVSIFLPYRKSKELEVLTVTKYLG